MESGVRVERGAWSGEWSGVEWSVENKAWIVWRVESRVESGERIGVKCGEWRVEREEWRLGRRVGRKAERKVLGWGRGAWREESRMSREKTKLEWKVKSRVESGGNCGEWSSEENGSFLQGLGPTGFKSRAKLRICRLGGVGIPEEGWTFWLPQSAGSANANQALFRAPFRIIATQVSRKQDLMLVS